MSRGACAQPAQPAKGKRGDVPRRARRAAPARGGQRRSEAGDAVESCRHGGADPARGGERSEPPGKRSAQRAERAEARGIPARRAETAQRSSAAESPVAKRRAQTHRMHPRTRIQSSAPPAASPACTITVHQHRYRLHHQRSPASWASAPSSCGGISGSRVTVEWLRPHPAQDQAASLRSRAMAACTASAASAMESKSEPSMSDEGEESVEGVVREFERDRPAVVVGGGEGDGLRGHGSVLRVVRRPRCRPFRPGHARAAEPPRSGRERSGGPLRGWRRRARVRGWEWAAMRGGRPERAARGFRGAQPLRKRSKPAGARQAQLGSMRSTRARSRRDAPECPSAPMPDLGDTALHRRVRERVPVRRKERPSRCGARRAQARRATRMPGVRRSVASDQRERAAPPGGDATLDGDARIRPRTRCTGMPSCHGLVDQVVGDAGAREGDDALRQQVQQLVVAPERGRAPVCVPVRLAHHLVHAVALGPLRRDALLDAGPAAVHEDEVRVLRLGLVEARDDGARVA